MQYKQLIYDKQTVAARWADTAYSTAKLRLHAGNFCEKCHFFGNDDPYRHKTQHKSWSCTWSSRVCVQNFTIIRHSVSEEISPRQNKQTLKYLVDN